MSKKNHETITTALNRAKGSGANHHGFSHWWMQRVTAIALIPLVIWFLCSLMSNITSDYQTFTNWISSPMIAITAILFLIAIFYHAALGLQVVIEDYMHCTATKMALSILTNLICIIMPVTAIYAILIISFG